MSKDTSSAETSSVHGPRDLRVLGYVLRRTNYGEADRILNIITPQGKISALAKGARKEKSKLAGGIEMFTLTDFNIHFGHRDLGIVTSAKMRKFHSNIIKDFARMELASEIIKQISRASENSPSDAYFQIVDQTLTALGENENQNLVEAWFRLNLAGATGEDVNLYRDNTGTKLAADQNYHWNSYERVFVPAPSGEYSANEIKLLRLMATADLSVVRRVKITDQILDLALQLARSL